MKGKDYQLARPIPRYHHLIVQPEQPRADVDVDGRPYEETMSLGGEFVRRNLRLFLRHSNKGRRLQFMTTIAEWPHYLATEPFYTQTPACGGLKADS